MTYEEAISRIKPIAESSRAVDGVGLFEPKPITIALEMAVEAMEKQVLKKVTHEATLYRNYTCPRCKNVVEEFIDFRGMRTLVQANRCKFCGQALLWEDTE